METQIIHSMLSSDTLVGRAMHCYAFRRLCLQGADRSSAARLQYTSRVAEVAADPPALQLPLALTQHARGRAAIVAACGC